MTPPLPPQTDPLRPQIASAVAAAMQVRRDLQAAMLSAQSQAETMADMVVELGPDPKAKEMFHLQQHYESIERLEWKSRAWSNLFLMRFQRE